MTDASYRGEPLITLHGQLAVAEGVMLTSAVRLAVEWFPLAAQNGPLGTAIDEVEYRNTYPAPFELPLFSIPSDAVLASVDGGTGRLGFGQIVAYRDGDGDERLTLAAPGGLVKDRVLATSGSFSGPFSPMDPAPEIAALVFAEAPLPAELEGLVRPGFSLVKLNFMTGKLEAAADASFQLLLRDDPLLSKVLCPDAYGPMPSPTACGLVPPVEPGTPLNLFGSALEVADDGSARVHINVWADSMSFINGANVTVNGTVISQVGQGGAYQLGEPQRSVVKLGDNLVRVEVAGRPVTQLTVFVPAAFTITAPATVQAGMPLTVSWSESAGASGYQFGTSDVGATGTVTGRTWVGTAPAQPGTLFIDVGAQGSTGDVLGMFNARALVTVAP